MKNNIHDVMDGIVLLIRGGGVKSASSIGVIKAFEENNIPIVAVSGTSIGSIPAALLSCGLNSDDILEIFIEYNDLIKKSARIIGGEGSKVIEDNMNLLLKKRKFSNTDIPCYINASDGPFYKASPFLFSDETTPDITLGEACRASASFPFFYKPYKTTIDGQKYNFTDGGSTLNTYIPESDNITVYSSFISDRERSALKRGLFSWEKPPYVAQAQANYSVIPDLGSMGTVGNIEDILNAYFKGYEVGSLLVDHLINEKNKEYVKF